MSTGSASWLTLFLLVSHGALGCAAGEEADGGGARDACAKGGCTGDTGGAPDGDDTGAGFDTDPGVDSGAGGDTAFVDTGGAGDTSSGSDTGSATETGTTTDSGAGVDTSPPADTGSGGVITGGPCISGSKGATAFRVRWTGTSSGSKATVSYEVHGLPDKSRWKVSAYGYSIGFSPVFVDPFLGEGGLQLDSSSFVDVEMSTKGLSSIKGATLAIYGRSFNTTASGSFSWQTFTGTGATPSGFVSNVAPYKWYAADATAAFVTGDGGVLLRIKAGPPSGALVVNRIELCFDAT